MSEQRKFIVSEEDKIVRIDKFLAEKMPEFSRSEIQKFSVSRENNTSLKLSEKIKTGDVFIVDIPEKKTDIATENISSDFDLDILFEDDDIIVINKPRGLLCIHLQEIKQVHWFKIFWHIRIYLRWVAMCALGLYTGLTRILVGLWYSQNLMRHIVN